MFKDNLPQYGFMMLENPLRMVKIDLRPYFSVKFVKGTDDGV
jgi:hypothetical protein